MSENTVISGPNQNEVVAPTNSQKGSKVSQVTKVFNKIANVVGSLVKTGDRKDVTEAVLSILNTIAAMNAAGEYDVGIQVRGCLYRFDEYRAPTTVARLVVASRVVVADTPAAYNLADYTKFVTGVEPMDPAEFARSVKLVCARLRTNPELVAINKPMVQVLADSNKYAVNGGKVEDSEQVAICFLKQTFDGDKVVDIDLWATRIALKMFS